MTAIFPTSLGSALFRRTLTETAAHFRVSGADYSQVEADVIPCSIYSPGIDASKLARVVHGGRDHSMGTIGVGLDADVRAKDRFVSNGRTYDVLAPLTPDSREWLHRVIVREVSMPERELWLALKPSGYDGAGTDEAEPELLRVLPVPYIVDKPVVSVNESGQVARLDDMNVSEIPRDAFSEANLGRLLFCMVLFSDVTPTPTDVAKTGPDKMFTRYRFNGPPVLGNHQWASDFPWSVGLVEIGK